MNGATSSMMFPKRFFHYPAIFLVNKFLFQTVICSISSLNQTDILLPQAHTKHPIHSGNPM
jgi:hypothetical protein